MNGNARPLSAKSIVVSDIMGANFEPGGKNPLRDHSNKTLNVWILIYLL